MGYNPKEYPMKISRWNNPLILTIDPNFQQDIQGGPHGPIVMKGLKF